MSIMNYNGGSVVAMKGLDCVAIATDRRFGAQALTISCDFKKTFEINSRLYYGLAGLATDVQTLFEKFRYRTNFYKLREEREIEPMTFAHMVSSALYEKRFAPYFAEPVIAGLDKNYKPYVCSMDLIGCINAAEDFAVAGSASQSLFGMCESLWREDMNEHELFEAISQALLNAADRDCLTGWGAVVHVISKDRVVTKTLRGRMD